MPKQAIRLRMLELRRRITPAEVLDASLRAQKLCMGLSQFSKAQVVALYSAIQNEIGTDLLMAEALHAGKTVLFPAVRGHGIEFRQLRDPAEMLCGSFGICEPPASSKIYPPEAIDFILVPGVAFDLAGKRIGYGKGYYDRTLHELEGSGRMAGLCYDFQLLESIAGAPHDVQMDMVITDQRVVYPLGHFT